MVQIESISNWVSVATGILTIISIIFTVLTIFRKKISESLFLKAVKSKINIYYLKIIGNRFLLGGIILAIIGSSLIIFAIFSLLSPTIVSHTFSPFELKQGHGQIFYVANDTPAILINKGQFFWWAKGWNLNAKLKGMELSYYAPNETLIRINLVYTIGEYRLNGKSTLPIGNISQPYQESINYGMSIINIGDAPSLFIFYKNRGRTDIYSANRSNFSGWIYLFISCYKFI